MPNQATVMSLTGAGQRNTAVRVQETYSLAKYVASAERIVSQLGIRIEFGSDFDVFCSIPKTQPERHSVSPIFDPARSDVSASNAFWLVGRDGDGTIVLTQAIKLIRIGKGGDFLDHLQENLGDYRPDGDKLDISRSTVSLTERASRLSGDACYYGELWISKRYRGSSLTAVMPRLMFAMALLKWSPQFMFGMMEPLAACKGLAAREGFMHLEQGGLRWHQRATAEPFEEWLVWTTTEDFLFNMRVSLDMLAGLYPSKAPAAQPSASKVA